MPGERQSWHRYFMAIAEQVATRATCPRKHVGAVIVRNKVILSTGYNGSIRSWPHCDEVGCLMEDGHCVRTVHAEMNAIASAAARGIRLDDAQAPSVIYVTAAPCWPCWKLVVNAGIYHVVYADGYRGDEMRALARTALNSDVPELNLHSLEQAERIGELR